MFKPVNMALFGVGRAGKIHFCNILASHQAKLLYLVDDNFTKAKTEVDKYGLDTKVLTSAESNQVFDDPKVDAVFICTPTHTHEALILQALKHGKGVFCEKPIAESVEGTKKCYEAAHKAAKPLLCSYNRRFDPSVRSLQSRVRAGELGKIYNIKSSARDHPFPPLDYLKISGGLFHDTATHDIDLICWVLGEYPETVFAMGHAHHEEIADMGDVDTVNIMMKFPSSALAAIDYSRHANYGYDQRCEVFGSTGMLISENQRHTELTHYHKDGSSMEPLKHSFPERYADSYVGALQHFVALMKGSAECEITMEHTIKVTEIVVACEESHKTGLPVKLNFGQ